MFGHLTVQGVDDDGTCLFQSLSLLLDDDDDER
jgi:hypothetical protein